MAIFLFWSIVLGNVFIFDFILCMCAVMARIKYFCQKSGRMKLALWVIIVMGWKCEGCWFLWTLEVHGGYSI